MRCAIDTSRVCGRQCLNTGPAGRARMRAHTHPISFPSNKSTPHYSLKPGCCKQRAVVRHSSRATRTGYPAASMVARAAAAEVQQVPAIPEVPAPSQESDEAPASTQGKPFVWEDHWYPVAFTCDLDQSKPHRFVLLNQPLVIWWQPEEQCWHVFQDVCPHRLVPLSEGRVNQRGELECGYHGWSFNGCGQCTRIPQGGNNTSKRANVIVYPSVMKQGLLFVKPTPLPRGTSLKDVQIDTSDVPVVAELDDPEWAASDTWRDIPYDATTLLENVIDSSHVSFTHHKTMSNRNQVGLFDMTVLEKASPTGFKGVWGTGPRAGAYGPQATWFRPPCYMQHKLDSAEKRGIESMVVVYAVPSTPGTCRLINRNLFRFTKSKLPAFIFRHVPKFAQHIGSQTLLEDDQIFLQLGEKEYSKLRAAGVTHGQAMYNASPADTFVTMFRSWLERFGGGGPFGKLDESYLSKLGPVLTVEQHLDRYSQHTQNCATCQAALKKLQALKAGTTFIMNFAAVAALLSLTLAVASVSLPAAAADVAVSTSQSFADTVTQALVGLVNWLCGAAGSSDRLIHSAAWGGLGVVAAVIANAVAGYEKQFYRGVYPPPRNLAKD